MYVDFFRVKFIGHTANLPFVGKFHNDWPKRNTSCIGFGVFIIYLHDEFHIPGRNK